MMTARLDRTEIIARLRAAAPAVLPSLLLCDFGDLAGEVRRLGAAGVSGLHFDVMDGDFAPNFTYGMPIVASLRNRTDLIFDAHLMISQPARYIEQFYAAGADVITIHAEAVDEPRPLLEKIRSLGAAAGLCIDTPTPVETIVDALPYCDLVLAMSVRVGFGGQKFDENALAKLQALRAQCPSETLLEVDGGVNPGTIAHCVQAGADLLVTGSAIFRTEDYTASVSQLQRLARQACTNVPELKS